MKASLPLLALPATALAGVNWDFKINAGDWCLDYFRLWDNGNMVSDTGRVCPSDGRWNVVNAQVWQNSGNWEADGFHINYGSGYTAWGWWEDGVKSTGSA